MTLKRRRTNVDATLLRRINVSTTSFWGHVPAGTSDSQQMDRILLRISYSDSVILDFNQQPEDLQPILREEVEIAVAALKKGKSAGDDNITAEFVLAGRETMTDDLTDLGQGLEKMRLTYPTDSVTDYYTA